MKNKRLNKILRLALVPSWAFLLFPANRIEAQIRMPQVTAQNNIVRFEENKNQWDKKVLFRAGLDGGALFLEKDALTYSFYDKETYHKLHLNYEGLTCKDVKTTGFKVRFVGGNSAASVEGKDPYRDYSNYFIGNDKSKWASGVPIYKETYYKDLWNGINLQILGNESSIKYNVLVKAGADAGQVKMKYEGVQQIKLKKGELEIKTILNELTEHKPYAYQEINGINVEVPCKFELNGNVVSFLFPKGYNKSYNLVIDPTLVFACSSGSTADNFGMTATYDSHGNLYSGGTAFAAGYPYVNAYDSTYNGIVQYGRTDVVITKYDSTGTYLHYSTYIGGAIGSEIVTSLIVDSQDNLYLYGATGSADFPTSTGCYSNTFSGGSYIYFSFNGTEFANGTDIYVAKLSPAGNQLLGSTYVGGSDNDGINNNNAIITYSTWPTGTGNPSYTVSEYPPDSLQYNYGDQYRGEIQLDNNENPIIASSTRSSDFPTQNALDASLGGAQDAVLVKLDKTLSSLLFSTYIGGSDNDAGYALYLDASDTVYMTGGTRSSDFPATAGTISPAYNGGKCDGYIAKVSPQGNQLIAATYIGTNSYDQSFFIQLDNQANVYVYGQSQGNMPVINAAYSNPNSKQFVTKLGPQLDTILFSTVIGNGNGLINLSPSAFLVDCSENIYLSGWGGHLIHTSANFSPAAIPPKVFNMPLTPNAHQSSNPDGHNFYLMVLKKGASQLMYATYFGGAQSWEHVDGGTSRFDRRGIIYQSVCAGCGYPYYTNGIGNDDFPVSPGAWPTQWVVPSSNINQSSNCNNGTFKFDFEFAVPSAVFSTSSSSGCSPLTVQFTNTSVAAIQYLWDFGNNDTTSTVYNPVHTFTTPGTYTVSLAVHNQACFNIWDTAKIVITVYPGITGAFTALNNPCSNTVNFTDQSVTTPDNWNWNFGDSIVDTLQNPVHTYPGPGTYTVTLIGANPNCRDTVQQVVNIYLGQQTATGDTTLCYGNPAPLNATGGISYSWSPATGLNNPNIASPVATPATSTVYTVTVTTLNTLGNSCSNTYTVDVNLFPRITADFNLFVNPCGNTVQFTDSSYASPVQWHWNYGDGNTGNTQNPVHSYGSPGTYSVTLIATNSNNCPDTTIQPLTIGGFTPISVNAPTTICQNQTAQLNASGGIAYSWSPPLTLSAGNIANPVASPTTTTTYSVDITSINTNGDTCVSTLTTTVNVSVLSASQLVATASPDTIVFGQYSSITTSLGPPYNITWNPAATLNNSTSFTPIASPHQTTTYAATVIDPAGGCVFLLNNVTIYVIANTCDQGTVFLPNTFTPNGDGRNDILYVRSNFITEVYLAIYNRWGQQVFETNDISKGWDGTYNGMKADPGVFGYYLKVKCNNGEETFRKGNITLIR